MKKTSLTSQISRVLFATTSLCLVFTSCGKDDRDDGDDKKALASTTDELDALKESSKKDKAAEKADSDKKLKSCEAQCTTFKASLKTKDSELSFFKTACALEPTVVVGTSCVVKATIKAIKGISSITTEQIYSIMVSVKNKGLSVVNTVSSKDIDKKSAIGHNGNVSRGITIPKNTYVVYGKKGELPKLYYVTTSAQFNDTKGRLKLVKADGSLDNDNEITIDNT